MAQTKGDLPPPITPKPPGTRLETLKDLKEAIDAQRAPTAVLNPAMGPNETDTPTSQALKAPPTTPPGNSQMGLTGGS